MVDKVEFWLSGAVYRFGDVMTNIFDSIFEKVKFIKSEADLIFGENFTDAFKVNKDWFKVYKEYKNVINIGAADRHTIRFIEVNVSVSATETVLLLRVLI